MKFDVPDGRHLVDLGPQADCTVVEAWWIGVGRCRAFLLDDVNAAAFAQSAPEFESAVSAESTESPVTMVVPGDGSWHVGVRFDVDGDIFSHVLTSEDDAPRT